MELESGDLEADWANFSGIRLGTQAGSSPALAYLGWDLSAITRLVVVIGMVDPGDNADLPS
jgi:hypothetical protein